MIKAPKESDLCKMFIRNVKTLRMYGQYVHRMCYEEINEECSKMGHKFINHDYETTQTCVKSTFEGPNF